MRDDSHLPRTELKLLERQEKNAGRSKRLTRREIATLRERCVPVYAAIQTTTTLCQRTEQCQD